MWQKLASYSPNSFSFLAGCSARLNRPVNPVARFSPTTALFCPMDVSRNEYPAQAWPIRTSHAEFFVLFLLLLGGWRCTPGLLEKLERPVGRILGPRGPPWEGNGDSAHVSLCAQETNVCCLGASVYLGALFVPVELAIIIS